MSHGKERKEKNCLNCNARVFGRYCHVCGQENTEPRETAWELVVHFFNDITHFEGKFISSIRYLLFKPGFLTAEYLRGRRASYMNPVRMYVFASAFFFILFFSFFAGEEGDPEAMKITTPTAGFKINTPTNKQTARQEALKDAETKEDSAIVNRLLPANDSSSNTTTDTNRNWSFFSARGDAYRTVTEYDSVQHSLPEEKRDKWLQRAIQRKAIVIKEKYGGDSSKFNKALLDHALHSIPKLLFISLPLFALILSLLYIRRKQFYYVSHLIFTIHLFVFVFLALLLIFTNNKIMDRTGWSTGWVTSLIWMYMFYYLYRNMRRVYEQGRWKTILKYILLLMLVLILYTFLFLGLFSYAFFNL